MSRMGSLLKNLGKPGYLKVVARKVYLRLTEGANDTQFLEWYRQQSHPLEDYSVLFDKQLYDRSLAYDAQLNAKAVSVLATLPVKLGGGGFCALLYYIILRVKPAVVLETGVAAGFSSEAILNALRENGKGKLYSSDFPYFRIDNPEKYIGILVDESLKKDWHLYIEGDQVNLRKIVGELGKEKIDILHYDSDKSYSGRQYALKTVHNNLHPKTLLIFDDINDNHHFYDLVTKLEPGLSFRIFAYKKKFVGVTCRDAAYLNEIIPNP
jgi:hypothetical protein